MCHEDCDYNHSNQDDYSIHNNLGGYSVHNSMDDSRTDHNSMVYNSMDDSRMDRNSMMDDSDMDDNSMNHNNMDHYQYRYLSQDRSFSTPLPQLYSY